jgi:hypothetical protein
LASRDCVTALQQLTTALEGTQAFIDQWLSDEEVAPIDSHNALPNNRKSLAFIQAVFKHNLSPSTISDAIEAVEELQFEVIRYREEAESAFRHLWYLYDVQRFRTLQGHTSVESFASLSSRASIQTLASISSRIAECSVHYTESDGEPTDESNDPIQWLQEQALRAGLHPLPANANFLPPLIEDNSDQESGEATRDDDSSVGIGSSERSTLAEIVMHRTTHQPILPEF